MFRGFTIVLFLLAPAYLAYLIVIYLRTKVPYVVTPRKRLSAILAAMHITPDTIIFDLGCGKGDILFAAEKFHPKKLTGFELSPLHAWYARVKAWLTRSKVQVHRQDFFAADISEADIIYMFLVQSAVEALWPKIQKEAKPGARVIVLCNHFAHETPTEIIELDEEQGSGARLYVYRMEHVTHNT